MQERPMKIRTVRSYRFFALGLASIVSWKERKEGPAVAT
jgi:hypothetical protein